MFRCQTARHMLHRVFSSRFPITTQHPSNLKIQSHCFTTSSTLFARKDTQDKNSIKTTSNEYSKSGSDDDAAKSGAAFDPNITRPEDENRTAGEEGGGSSLDVSPSNPEVSKPKESQEYGSTKSPRDKTSGRGSPEKRGDTKHG